MKRNCLISLLLLAATVLMIMSCTSKHSAPESWEEMDKFHLIMAECFHPYKDSSNLEPAKRLAQEMSVSAKAWNAAKLPASVDTDDVKSMLGSLEKETADFVTIVKSEDDEAIAKLLTDIHNEFHHLQEAWYSARSDEHHEDHH